MSRRVTQHFIPNGEKSTTGTASSTSSGSATAGSDVQGTISLEGTTGGYTGKESSNASHNVSVTYTYDPDARTFTAKDGGTVSSKQSGTSAAKYSGSGPSSTSYSFQLNQTGENSSTLTVANGNWSKSASDSGDVSSEEHFSSSSSGGYTTQYGLSGTSTGSSKNDVSLTANWKSTYKNGVWSYSGDGSYDANMTKSDSRSAGGSYTSGDRTGSYSESASTDEESTTKISLSKSADWVLNGSRTSKIKGDGSMSDTWNSSSSSSTATTSSKTKTDSDTGHEYKYKLQTEQTVANNEWLAETGSGTDTGKAWSTFTTSTDGTFTSQLGLPQHDANRSTKAPVSLTGTTKSNLSETSDYEYKTVFTRSSSGWIAADSGTSSYKYVSHSETDLQGANQDSGSKPRAHVREWDPQKGQLQFNVSASIDSSSRSDTQIETSSTWGDGRSTSTTSAKSSLNIHNKSDQSVTAQLWDQTGNVGSGQGSLEAYSYAWRQSAQSDTTETSTTSLTSTTGKGGGTSTGSYQYNNDQSSSSDWTELGHYVLTQRSSGSENGVNYLSKADGLADSIIKSNLLTKQVTTKNWQATDGAASTDTYLQTFTQTGHSLDKYDTDSWAFSRTWNSEGILSYMDGGFSAHRVEDIPIAISRIGAPIPGTLHFIR